MSMNCSDTTAAQVDQEVIKLLKQSYDQAKKILSEHRKAMDEIAAFLIEKETITGKEFMEILHKVEGTDVAKRHREGRISERRQEIREPSGTETAGTVKTPAEPETAHAAQTPSEPETAGIVQTPSEQETAGTATTPTGQETAGTVTAPSGPETAGAQEAPSEQENTDQTQGG